MKNICIILPATPTSINISRQQATTVTQLEYSLSPCPKIVGFIKTLDISVSISIMKVRSVTQITKTHAEYSDSGPVSETRMNISFQ